VKNLRALGTPDSARYNAPVKVRCCVAGLMLSATVLAQAPPPSCPADRPVDDIIAEIQKQQSKKNSRNKNPLPDMICIFGWCRSTGKQPPAKPQPVPREETPRTEDVSSSRAASDRCNDATERALEAAHNVEVGDYYLAEKNYKAALFRYEDAAEQKKDDNAIRVRLGRVFEKLNDIPQALESYKSAQKLAGPEKWTQEAKAAVARLEHAP
jgi:tetratricopeptide (TPR) repeat protein